MYGLNKAKQQQTKRTNSSTLTKSRQSASKLPVGSGSKSYLTQRSKEHLDKPTPVGAANPNAHQPQANNCPVGQNMTLNY